jgi:voltage-gated potassium channel
MALGVQRIWGETLTFLALAFLFAFSYPAFVNPISPSTQSLLNAIQWITWVAFAGDLLYGFFKAPHKKTYLKKHPLEVAAVLLPFLRPLRLMRVISFGGLAIQKVAIGRQFAITIKVFIASIFVAYISAVQITISERELDGSNIKNFGDGIWWAITTVTTVGYGDRYPTTTEGRFLAVLLMLVGISLVGVITASVAAWFVKMSANELEQKEKSD